MRANSETPTTFNIDPATLDPRQLDPETLKTVTAHPIAIGEQMETP